MTDTVEKTEEEELAESKAAEEAEAEAKRKAEEEAELGEGEDASTKAKEEADALAAEEAKKAAEGKKEGDDEPTAEDLLREEIAELKEKHATADSATRALEGKLSKINETLKEAGMATEEDPEEQKHILAAENARREYLSNLLEMMSVNPKYEGLEEVLTTHNKQLVIEAYAANVVKDDPSVNEDTAIIAVKQTINELSNPHKFFYDQIKALEKGSKEATKEVKKKDPEMTTAPGNVKNMGGGGGDGGAWTFSKLDNMTEEQLAKSNVPQDILDQWKMGTLPK